MAKKISLVKTERYPELKKLIKKFMEYTPLAEMEGFSKNNYNPPLHEGEDDKRVEIANQAKKDLNTLIMLFKAYRAKRICDVDSLLLKRVINERELFAKERTTKFQKDNFKEWYNNRVIEQVKEYWIEIFTLLREMFSIHYTDAVEKELTPMVLFDNWFKHFSAGNSKPGIINALDLIDPVFIILFEEIEKKIIDREGKFKSKVRCAAFCEMLYDKKYIMHTDSNQITMAEFAKARYGLYIKGTLLSDKRQDRANHKNNKVSNLPRLKDYFI